MSAAHHAHRLDRLRLFLRTDPAGLATADAFALAAGLDKYFGDRVSLDEAMGVHLDHGEGHPGRTIALAARDAELRSGAAKLGPINYANSLGLAAKFERYYSGPWQLERSLAHCPASRSSRIEGNFWRALKAWPRTVKGRRMHEIVAAQRELKEASDCGDGNSYSNSEGSSVSVPLLSSEARVPEGDGSVTLSRPSPRHARLQSRQRRVI